MRPISGLTVCPGPRIVVGVVQGVAPAGTNSGNAACNPSIRGLPLIDWNKFSAWLPTYRASKTEPAISSRCKPKDQECVLCGPKSGEMLVSLNVLGSKAPRTNAEAKSDRLFGPVGFASKLWVPMGVDAAESVCKNTM